MLGLTLVLGVLGAVLADVAPTFVSETGCLLGLTLVLGVLGAVLADVAPTFVSGAGGLAAELAEPPAGGWADVEAAGGMSGMSTLVFGTLGPAL